MWCHCRLSIFRDFDFRKDRCCIECLGHLESLIKDSVFFCADPTIFHRQELLSLIDLFQIHSAAQGENSLLLIRLWWLAWMPDVSSLPGSLFLAWTSNAYINWGLTWCEIDSFVKGLTEFFFRLIALWEVSPNYRCLLIGSLPASLDWG